MELVVIILIALALFGVISWQGLFGYLGFMVVVGVAVPLAFAIISLAFVAIRAALTRK